MTPLYISKKQIAVQTFRYKSINCFETARFRGSKVIRQLTDAVLWWGQITTTKVDDDFRRIPLWKKKPLPTSNQVKNTLNEVAVCIQEAPSWMEIETV